MSQYDRRKFLSVGAVGLATTAVGMRAVLAQGDSSQEAEETGAAGAATPGATPGATPSAAAAETFEVIGVDIDFEPSAFSIPADTDVEIQFINEGALPHDFNIEDTEYGTKVIDGGEETSITVNLSAGDYVYYCSVPGHREAGMEGTLTVE